MAKPGKAASIFKPAVLTLAASAGWAAAHVPGSFTPASTGVWLFGAVTVALLTRAALALATPLLGILGVIFGRTMKTLQQRPGAES